MALFRKIKAWIAAGGKFYSLYLLITSLFLIVGLPLIFILGEWAATISFAMCSGHMISTFLFYWLDKRSRDNKELAAQVMAELRESTSKGEK